MKKEEQNEDGVEILLTDGEFSFTLEELRIMHDAIGAVQTSLNNPLTRKLMKIQENLRNLHNKLAAEGKNKS